MTLRIMCAFAAGLIAGVCAALLAVAVGLSASLPWL
jgi:hypothetical protein